MRYRDNTVKGTRRGSKWPEAVKTACMCDLLTDNNLSVVARRHGVPESTLRTWERQARRKTPEEQKSLFEAAREQELRELNRKASAAANNSVDYVRRRLERNDRDAEIYEWALRRLNELDGVIPYEGPDDAECEALGPVRTVRPEKPGERERMQALMERNRPMSDFAAASYMRGLVSVTERVSKMLGDGAEDSGIVVVLPEDKGAFE